MIIKTTAIIRITSVFKLFCALTTVMSLRTLFGTVQIFLTEGRDWTADWMARVVPSGSWSKASVSQRDREGNPARPWAIKGQPLNGAPKNMATAYSIVCNAALSFTVVLYRGRLTRHRRLHKERQPRPTMRKICPSRHPAAVTMA